MSTSATRQPLPRIRSASFHARENVTETLYRLSRSRVPSPITIRRYSRRWRNSSFLLMRGSCCTVPPPIICRMEGSISMSSSVGE